MDRNTLKKIFAFIEEKEGKTSLAYKILYDFDNIRDNELIINGNLDLSNKNITSLPFGLQVYGYLILLGCTSLTSLPDGLQVGGYLVLSGCTSLTTLPDGLQVGGNLNIANTPLANYTDGELLKMIGSTGYMNGIIKRKCRG